MLLTRQQLRAHVMASEDETRPAIGHVKIKPDGTTIATNGHIVVRVAPKTAGMPDETQFPPIHGLDGHQPTAPVFLPAAVASAAERIVPRTSDLVSFNRARLLVNGQVVIGATDLRTPHLVMADQHPATAAEFPEAEHVIPTKAGLSIVLNADLIELIAKYANSFAHLGVPAIKFTFYGPNDAVRFEWDDERHHVDGALMPVVVAEKEAPKA